MADLARPATASWSRGGPGGGRGNAQLRHADAADASLRRGRAPRMRATLELRLKLVADAALAGLPNAGKLALLRRISNATPKVAGLPVHDAPARPRHGRVGRRRAAHGRPTSPASSRARARASGLGHEFLAHLERARLLVHVIDGSEGDADERFATIDRELGLYGAGLDSRPQIVVLNKSDLSPEPAPFSSDDPRILEVHRVSLRDGRGDRGIEAALFVLCPAAPEPAGRAGRRAAGVPRLPADPTRASRSYRILRHRSWLPGLGRAAPEAPSSRRRCVRRVSGAGRSSRSATRSSNGSRERRHARGAFDPPHVGHVALARAGVERFRLARLLVRVVAEPGHKDVATAPPVSASRLRRLAFASVTVAEVALDSFARTVDSLEALDLEDPVFLVGADEFAAFLAWKEPERVLSLARLGVATRPGVDRTTLDAVLVRLRATRPRDALRPRSRTASPRQRSGSASPPDSRSTASSRSTSNVRSTGSVSTRPVLNPRPGVCFGWNPSERTTPT